MKLTKEQTLGVIRHILTFTGGVLIAKGLIDESLITDIIGAAMTLVGGVWSIVEKNKKPV
jgi:hypothetical protein